MKADKTIEKKFFEIYPFNETTYVVVSRGDRTLSKTLNKKFCKYSNDTVFRNGDEPYYKFSTNELYTVMGILRPWS